LSFGQGHRFHVTGLAHDETGFPTNNPKEIDRLLRRLHRKITRHAEKIIQVDEDYQKDADVAIVAYGSTARSARQAVKLARQEGVALSFLALLTLWPFPARQVEELSNRVSSIIVPEMNLGQMAHEVEWASGRKAAVHSITRVDGEPIHPAEILGKIREVHESARS